MFSNDTDYIIHEKTEKTPAAGTAGFSGLPNMLGFIKEYYESGTKCKVTFRLPRERADNIKNVAIVGDFNNWDTSKSLMTRLGNGDYVITMDLDSNAEYRFRYLIDGHRWENDWYADRFAPNGLGSKDSVVIV
jgi:1,4-alpha-glucan branching enzyme